MTRHFGKRTAALLLTLCMVTLLLPATAFAATAPTIKAINFIDGGSSTVYVNEATSSGAGSDSIKYIYSNDILLVSNVLDGLKTLLGADHAALVPAPSESAGIAASTSGTPTADWADAEYVAENVIAGSGTVTSSTNNIDASAASMATDLATLGTELEAENKAAWETQEAENKAAWEAAEQEKKNADPSYVIQPYVPSEYVPSVYVPLDFTGTTLGPLPTLAANEFAHSVGTFLTGPFYKYESGVIKESYDINLVCHTVTVLSETANKAIPFDAVTLPVSTIESAADTDYVLRGGVTATFTPDAAITPGTLDATTGDGVKIDYYNPMQSPTGLDSGYSKLVEYNIQIPLTGYAGSTLTGAITLPLPSGHDGATAKIVGGATATSSTGATVTFPITLAVSGNVASLTGMKVEYKEKTTPTPSSDNDYYYTPLTNVTIYNPNATIWLTGSSLPANDQLITEWLSSGGDYNALLKLADAEDVFRVYNIRLQSGKSATGSAMYLHFDLAPSYANQPFTLVHKLADGTYEYFYVTADANGDLVFGPLYSLSPYMLVKGTLAQIPVYDVVDIPKTGDSASPIGYIMLAAAGAFGITLVIFSKKRRRA